MALAPLASTADLPGVWMSHVDGGRALDVASAAIRDAADSAISRQTSTVVVIGGRGQVLALPGPVVEVTSVTVDGWTLSSSEYVVLPEGVWRRSGWGDCDAPTRVTVTYTYGLVTVPADLVDLTVHLAVAWLRHFDEGGGSTAGLKSVRLDDASEAYSDELAGQVSPVFIPEVTRRWLRARFGGGAVVVETL